ncbi:MAG: hypothetical protein NVV73_07395 [Cellvibrionaceae bacterium]|nr:hypothetical protein [Cellvibrionaceae bacterium]
MEVSSSSDTIVDTARIHEQVAGDPSAATGQAGNQKGFTVHLAEHENTLAPISWIDRGEYHTHCWMQISK